MDQLPKPCKDCAEYGSQFCEDCLNELNQKLSEEEKNIFDTTSQIKDKDDL